MKYIIKIPITQEVIVKLQKKQDKINSDEEDHKYWKKLSTAERKEITEKLSKSQGNICCYCECRIDKNNRHIERLYI